MKINVIVLERKILPEYMYFKSTFIRKDFTWNMKEQLLVMHNLSFLFSVIVFGILGVGVSFAVRKLGGTVLQVHMWFSVYTNLSKRTLYKLYRYSSFVYSKQRFYYHTHWGFMECFRTQEHRAGGSLRPVNM